MNKLLFVGKHTKPGLLGVVDELTEAELEEALEKLGDGEGYTDVLTCDNVEDLIVKAKAFRDENGPIDILDILDHGVPGGIVAGDQVLFHVRPKPDGTLEFCGRKAATALASCLTETGVLRLLGCKTALGARGRLMLLVVQQALGAHRVVFGTLERVDAGDFDTDRGFTQENEMLFSSLAALDNEAPGADTERQPSILWMFGAIAALTDA